MATWGDDVYMKLFIIAGTAEEAMQWMKNDYQKRINAGDTLTTLSNTSYVHVTSVDMLRGFKNPHGVFIGSWRERPDIYAIVWMLQLQSDFNNQAIAQIYDSLK